MEMRNNTRLLLQLLTPKRLNNINNSYHINTKISDTGKPLRIRAGDQ